MEKQNDIEFIKFKQIYEELYSSCKVELNTKRISYVIKMSFTIIFSVFIMVFLPYLIECFKTNEQFLYYYNQYNTCFLLIYCVLIFIVIFTLILRVVKYKEELEDIFKTKILSKLFDNLLLNVLNITFSYNLFEAVGKKDEYKNVKFDNKQFKYFEIENYIKGTLKSNYIMQMMYVYTSNPLSNRGRHNAIYSKYSGHYLIIDKKIDSELRIYTKARRKDLKEELVISDNMIFNDNFKIYCSQNEIVQKYLTNELMDCLLNFKEKYKIHFDLVLKDKVYIRFHTLNLLEPILFGSVIDRSLYKLYVIIKFTEDLIKILDKVECLPQ